MNPAQPLLLNPTAVAGASLKGNSTLQEEQLFFSSLMDLQHHCKFNQKKEFIPERKCCIRVITGLSPAGCGHAARHNGIAALENLHSGMAMAWSRHADVLSTQKHPCSGAGGPASLWGAQTCTDSYH